ncbi:FtsX-like permease family protein [Diaminobutyricibacter tongyongensis]|uniref:FtsX-like permease family protein n=1 Tax=Leifsonia tongyongensis TaxID=1268043 RepID=A0A6L9XYF2_9MICO|nr:FtsX-like permease family protein [Diaminobutyricibacter tongyongensis]NEN06479.1 FtsX-like permease family protein [Diaminobutyricibacter tongyongensis]
MSGAITAVRTNAREHRASILVSALSSAFGVSLLSATGVLATYIAQDRVGEHGSVKLALSIVAGVFFVIAVYVGAIVTTNTFATIVAGRTRTIALLRLIGSSSRAQRRAVAGEGFVVGVVGAVAGAIIGITLTIVAVRAFVAVGTLPDLAYPLLEPVNLVPVVVVVLTTWLASWVGSRRVLSVTPIQAIGAAQEPTRDELRRKPVRNALAFGMVGFGAVLLAGGIVIGLVSPLGVLVGLVGGILSFTGIVLAAHLFMPSVLRGVGRLFGRSAPARLAAANAVRNPERSTRTTIGLVIGVTLITMFVVAASSYQRMILIAQQSNPELFQGVDSVIAVTTVVFSVLIGFSAVIAAIGVVNNLSLSVLQRTRELGLLRALGFSARQVRALILSESAQLTIAAVLAGLVLGVIYGWAGAQSLLGSLPGGAGFVLPVVPWQLLAIAAVVAAGLAIVASVAPTRRATGVSPVAALAID